MTDAYSRVWFYQDTLDKAEEEARGPIQTALGHSNPNAFEIKMVHFGHQVPHIKPERSEPENVIYGSSVNCTLQLTTVPTTPYCI